MTRLLPLLLLSACAGDPFTLLLLPDTGPALAVPWAPSMRKTSRSHASAHHIQCLPPVTPT